MLRATSNRFYESTTSYLTLEEIQVHKNVLYPGHDSSGKPNIHNIFLNYGTAPSKTGSRLENSIYETGEANKSTRQNVYTFVKNLKSILAMIICQGDSVLEFWTSNSEFKLIKFRSNTFILFVNRK
jgi:hypothetical protein